MPAPAYSSIVLLSQASESDVLSGPGGGVGCRELGHGPDLLFHN